MSTLDSEEVVKMARPQKIQIGLIISVLALIGALAVHLEAYARSYQQTIDGLAQAKRDIEEMKPKTEDIPVIKDDITHISKSLDEIKTMIERK